MTLFTILICCSLKKGFSHLFTFTIKALSYTGVSAKLAHFTHSASIFRNRKTQRSLVRGRGTSIVSVWWQTNKGIHIDLTIIYNFDFTEKEIKFDFILFPLINM